MTWTIEWRDDGSGVATHSGGLKLWVTRSGWATVTEQPPRVDELEATLLIVKLQRLLTGE